MAQDDQRGGAALVPWVLGGLVLALGVVLGVFGGGAERADGTPTPPLPAPTAAPEDDAELPAPPSTYAPDLGGPEVGEVLLAEASEAHALTARDGRLVWLTTEGATLGSAGYDGGGATPIYSDHGETRFGGELARTDQGAFFSIDDTTGEPEPIFFVSARGLGAPGANLEPIMEGSSPGNLVAEGATLFFSDLGRVLRLEGQTPVVLAERQARIAAMALHDGTLHWIEAPMQGAGRHALVAMPDEGREPKTLLVLEAATRDLLVSDGRRLIWTHEDGDGGHALMRYDLDGEVPKEVTPVGLVTAVAAHAGRVYWAELHGDEPAVSLLRSVSFGEDAPRLHGRRTGTVTALAADGDWLFFCHEAGLLRLRL